MATDYLEKNPPTDADLQAIYDENLSRLSGQQYKARHILVSTKEEADSVIAQLRDGSDFIALAQERADGPTGPNGGALDWFTLDSMPPPFAEAVAVMTVGSYSQQPVQTEVWLPRDPARGQTAAGAAGVGRNSRPACERR